MESRLPQPKIHLSKTIASVDLTMKVTTQRAAKDKAEQASKSSSQTSNALKKAKSTLNLAAKAAIENKPPTQNPTQTLVRSKTLGTITTKTGGASKPLKRLGTATTHGEPKKFIKATATRPTATQRPGGSALTTSSTVNKTASLNGKKPATAAAPPKPSKWDLKGRLAHTADELTNIKQKHKDILSKNSELQDIIDNLKANENSYKSKVGEYEVINKDLDAQIKELRGKMNEVQEEKNDLSKRLVRSEESYETAAKMLVDYKDKCSSQQVLLTEKASEVQSLRIDLQNLQSDLESKMKANEELTTLKNELQSLVHRLDMDRRVLHNAIQELKGNIRVFCRVRPKTLSEVSKGLCSINFIDECTIEVAKSDGSDSMSCSGKMRGTRQEFSFDKVFPPHTTQEDIFKELSLLVQSALEGYNVCVFAYGQTGSGKTYTMEGMPGLETEGMIPRTVRHIFREMKQFQLLGWEYKIEASFLEIYNEHIVDLLDPQPKTYEIRMADAKGHDLYVSNLTIQEIHSPEELQECLLSAQQNRAVAATQSNERSSRSHSVARIRLIGTHLSKGEVSIGNLNLVDLAGSERLKGEESARVAETKNINKSLANLGNVILALLKKQEHVPYRNSKLTHLLMPSLGGNSKTLMLLNISPLDECYNETLNSLRFASNVNSCKTGNVKRTRTVLQSNA